MAGVLAALDRILDRLIDVCGAIAMSAVTAAGILITVDVAMRGLGLGVVYGGTETVEYLVFLTAFYSAPWVLRQNAHIRVDFLLQLVPKRVARGLEAFADAVGTIVVLLMLYYAARIGVQSFREGRIVFKTYFFPEWWIYAAASLALFLLLLEFVRRTSRSLRGGAEPAAGQLNW
jgi:TRAP-type C4-dicarboxylate transport system permease small subunit